MKALLALALISTGALAETNNFPAFYGKLSGHIATTITQRETFSFTPGTMEQCERKDVVSSMTTFKCALKGTSMDIGGGKIVLEHDKMFVFYNVQKGGDVVREYILDTRYTDKTTGMTSAARVTIWNYASKPNEVRGSVKLTDLGVLGGIQASPVN